MLFRVITVFCLLGLITACVTSYTEDGTEKSGSPQEIDTEAAARGRIALGIKYLRAGDAKQAKYNLDKALEFAPNLPEVHTSLAFYYQSVNENDLSESAYNRALKLEPDNADTLNNYGVFLCRVGTFEQAEEQFLKAIDVPTYIRVEESYENLALCALKAGKFDTAEKYLQKALDHNPRRATSLINMAYLQYARSNYTKAAEYYRRYEKAARLSDSGLMFGVQLSMKQGRPDQAQGYGQMLVSMFPQSSFTKKYLRNDIRGYADRLQDRYKQQFREQYAAAPSQPNPQAKVKVVKKKSLKPNTYKVKKGDTLWSIANKHNTSVENLLRWNEMDDSSKLIAGSTIVVSSPGE